MLIHRRPREHPYAHFSEPMAFPSRAAVSGEAVDRIIAMISSAPPETAERLGKALGSEK